MPQTLPYATPELRPPRRPRSDRTSQSIAVLTLVLSMILSAGLGKALKIQNERRTRIETVGLLANEPYYGRVEQLVKEQFLLRISTLNALANGGVAIALLLSTAPRWARHQRPLRRLYARGQLLVAAVAAPLWIGLYVVAVEPMKPGALALALSLCAVSAIYPIRLLRQLAVDPPSRLQSDSL